MDVLRRKKGKRELLILTIVMMNSGIVLDIMVKPEQRIKDILKVLEENGRIIYRSGRDILYIDVEEE